MKHSFEALSDSKFNTFEGVKINNACKIQGGNYVLMSTNTNMDFDSAERSAAANGGTTWDDVNWHVAGSFTALTWASTTE